MKQKVIKWLSASNRWKHLVGGVMIGLGADDWYCACYTGAGVAASLELKDKLWGGEWDWIDFGLTMAGVGIGRIIRIAL